MRKDAAPYVWGSAYRAATVQGHDNVCATDTEMRIPTWHQSHQHAVKSDRLGICQTGPTSRWKSWRSRCRSTDVEPESSVAVTAEPSTIYMSSQMVAQVSFRPVGMSAAGSTVADPGWSE